MTTFLSLEAAADLSGFSVRHFKRISLEELPIVRIGKRHLILRADLEAWLKSQRKRKRRRA